jgi:hypothetical protein
MTIKRLNEKDRVAMHMIATCVNARTKDFMELGLTFNRINSYARAEIIKKVGHQSTSGDSTVGQIWALTETGRNFIKSQYPFECAGSTYAIQHNVAVAEQYVKLIVHRNIDCNNILSEREIRRVVESRLEQLKTENLYQYSQSIVQYKCGRMSMPDLTYLDDDRIRCIEIITKKYTEEEIDAKRNTAAFLGAEINIVLINSGQKRSSQINSGKRQDQQIQKHKDVIDVILRYGSGVMLRQQCVLLVARLTKKPEVDVRMALHELQKSNVITSRKVFEGCKNNMLILSKRAVSALGEKNNSRPSSLSQQSMIYHIFRTECYLNTSNLAELPQDHIYFAWKGQEKKLYQWFEGLFPVNYGFSDDFDIANGKGSPVNFPGLRKYDTFNFRTLLCNNIVVMWGRNIKEKREIVFEVLNTHKMSISHFKDLVHCVVRMLYRYTNCQFDNISFRVVFFNSNERNDFRRKWEKVKFKEYLMEKNVYCYVANACTVDFVSLDLDRKYHLYRDIG